MKIIAKGIGVDAGLIMIADLDYLRANHCTEHDYSELDRLGKTFKVSKGDYLVSWHIRETWDGPIEGVENLRITSGTLVVIDPCYVFGEPHERWQKWLNDNDYGNEIDSESAFVIDQMGGDGEYKVELLLEEKA